MLDSPLSMTVVQEGGGDGDGDGDGDGGGDGSGGGANAPVMTGTEESNGSIRIDNQG